MATKSLGCSVYFVSEVCYADANGRVGHQRREQCEDSVADPLQTITAMVRSKCSVVQDCIAGCRERVAPTRENEGVHWCLDIHWWSRNDELLEVTKVPVKEVTGEELFSSLNKGAVEGPCHSRRSVDKNGLERA